VTACDATGCLAPPMIQIYNVLEDPTERNNLASNATLATLLLALITAYNRSAYIDPLIFQTPVEHDCPYIDGTGVLTPCSIPRTSR